MKNILPFTIFESLLLQIQTFYSISNFLNTYCCNKVISDHMFSAGKLSGGFSAKSSAMTEKG